MTDDICVIDGCTREIRLKSKGYCAAHHMRYWKYGDPLFLKRVYKRDTKQREYWIYIGILQRCNNPNNKAYKDYGGRGIKVCEWWTGMYGFDHFLEDMGKRPTDDHTIERKDTELGYQPDNCIWATRNQQARNTRRSTAHPGVTFDKTSPNRPWRVLIKYQGFLINIPFHSLEEAIHNRDTIDLQMQHIIQDYQNA